MKIITVALCGCLVAACSSPPQPIAQTTEPPVAEAPKPAPAPSQSGELTPDDVAGLRALLMARHARDLPTRATLDKHANAERVLQLLAQTDAMLIVRARALQLLGNYPTRDTEQFLLGVVTDASQHAKLRAAAIRGLGAYDLEASTSIRAVVVEQLESNDVRVGAAAVAALRNTPSATADLKRISAQDGIPEQVRKAAADVVAKSSDRVPF